VEIGPLCSKYKVEKACLTGSSEHFRDALKDTSKEGVEELLTLTETEPETFDIFLDWVDTGKLPL
jgi:hypothetical protein